LLALRVPPPRPWYKCRMGGQGTERRDILRYIGIASVAATFPGFRQWAFACSHNPAGDPSPLAASQASKESYKPLFFSPQQFRLVEHLAEMIIPADETPGAKQAGVAEFIDFMLANRVSVSAPYDAQSSEDLLRQGNEVQEQFITGLAWINARSKSEFGHTFLDCTSEQQNNFLEELAYKAKFKPTTEEGREFFQLLRDYTVVGYYTTKIGLESLGYPGLRAVWPKMPGCTHPNDPEHAHLQEPGQSTASIPSHK
jgi:gluconate 2-dehydrogenase gamma chain